MKTSSNIQDPQNNRIDAIRAKREELKGLSQPFRAMVKEGAIDSINEGLKGIYSDKGHTTLKTLKQWNAEGMKVKKGEHAFLLWGSPVNRTRKTENEEPEDEETDYFPVCFVFSQKQVEPSQKN
jgi:hypothetical protein